MIDINIVTNAVAVIAAVVAGVNGVRLSKQAASRDELAELRADVKRLVDDLRRCREDHEKAEKLIESWKEELEKAERKHNVLLADVVELQRQFNELKERA